MNINTDFTTCLFTGGLKQIQDPLVDVVCNGCEYIRPDQYPRAWDTFSVQEEFSYSLKVSLQAQLNKMTNIYKL